MVMRNAYKFFVRKYNDSILLMKTLHTLEDGVKINFKEMRYEGVDSINLSQVECSGTLL
jgi:hypothetical protein